MVSAALIVASVAFLVAAAVRNAESLRAIELRPAFPALAVAAVTSYCGAVAAISVGWTLLIRSTGAGLTYRGGWAAVSRSQVGKYLPGNVFQYLGRVALTRAHGVPVRTAVAAVFIESAMLVTIGLASSAVRARAALDAVSDAGVPVLLVGAMLAAAALLTLGATIAVRRRGAAFVGVAIAPRALAPAAAGFALALLLLAIQPWLLSQGLQQDSGSPDLLTSGWAFIVAWCVGFVVPGVPGGIGVREAVFVAVMTPHVGTADAVALAGATRLVGIAGDLVLFALASAFAERRPEDESVSAASQSR